MENRLTFNRCMLLGAAWTVLAFLLLPMVVIFPVSLTDQYYLSLPKEGLSFEHYANYFSNEDWLNATGRSFFIALIATFLSVILGTACAIGCWRLSNRLSETVRALMLTPIIVPPIVQALSFYNFWIDLGIVDTYVGVILAHTLICIPYVVITVSSALAGFDPRVEQAARSLGASVPQTVRWVIVPNVLPGILSGSLFAFTISFDEIVTVLFITSYEIYTLPKMIWNGIQDHLDPTIAAVATLLIVLTCVLLLIDFTLRGARTRVQ